GQPAMSSAEASAARGGEEERCRYKGVRRRRWGKWVSEIRVPGTRERLWLGSYATPEAAAVAHDTAVYFLRGGSLSGNGAAGLNFPERAAAAYGAGSVAPLSPRSVQSVASDAGMAADAQLVAARDREQLVSGELSVDDMEILM
uniref:AP2/ERF domain-containing protein n=1 Tax=Aegilops tauschii subsp. strangulata TaxID=200361 RepID=A0A453G6Q1_AEGTS